MPSNSSKRAEKKRRRDARISKGKVNTPSGPKPITNSKETSLPPLTLEQLNFKTKCGWWSLGLGIISILGIMNFSAHKAVQAIAMLSFFVLIYPVLGYLGPRAFYKRKDEHIKHERAPLFKYTFVFFIFFVTTVLLIFPFHLKVLATFFLLNFFSVLRFWWLNHKEYGIDECFKISSYGLWAMLAVRTLTNIEILVLGGKMIWGRWHPEESQVVLLNLIPMLLVLLYLAFLYLLKTIIKRNTVSKETPSNEVEPVPQI